MREHDDPGDGAGDAGLPRAVRAEEAAVPVVLLRVLAQVPDVAVLVLRVPVLGVLDQAAVELDDVVHDRRGDADDRTWYRT